MAPSVLNKAINDRNSISDTLDFLQLELDNHVLVPLDEARLTLLLAMVKTSQTDVMDIHKNIQAASPPDMVPHTLEYQRLLGKSLGILTAFTKIKMSTPVTSTTTATHSMPDLKLPRLELPTFDGDLHKWTSFRDMFEASIHSNATLSKAQKFNYLKSQLKGEAGRQISNMLITDGNYDIAWSQLHDRYQNDREIMFAIMRKLFNQATVQPHSAVSLRTLVDTSQECIRSLDVLGLPTDQWDAILLFLLVTKLDSSSKELWELSLKDSSIPTLKSLVDFLEQRARALAASGSSTTSTKHGTQDRRHMKGAAPAPTRAQAFHTSTSCPVCKGASHAIHKCETFLGWNPQQRAETIKKLRLCFNCFQGSHSSAQCPRHQGCWTCGARHHSLLHRTPQSPAQVVVNPGARPNSGSDPLVHFTTNSRNLSTNLTRRSSSSTPVAYDTLLATAVVQVRDRNGYYHFARVLVDNGSNTHFVTDAFAKKLQLPRKRCNTSATGLGGSSVAVSSGLTSFLVSPHFDVSISFAISRCLITNRITGKLPTSLFDHTRWSHLQNLQLADPHYHQPQDVDMLLGAEFFFATLECKKSSGPPNSPVALQTSFGWLIGGGSAPIIGPEVHTTISNDNINNKEDLSKLTTWTDSISIASDHDDTLDSTLRKFWEIETVPTARLSTPDEVTTESHFSATHRRNEDGRFEVQLPFNPAMCKPNATPRPSLGHSLPMAMKRFQLLEKRLHQRPECREEYIKFMREYEALGHMKEVLPVDSRSTDACYIPHHFVTKNSSTTTKFRVVFDASSKTSNGVSLNDTLLVGPTIQDSLVDLILRFRLHKVAFTADIAKMYRQVLVSPNDADFQRIVWREDPSQPLKHYQLCTVTYGTASASFLACRALQELGRLNKETYPRASLMMVRDFYMDDLMSGEPSVDEALQSQEQLLKTMESGCLSLRKWSSNSQAVLDALPPDMRETQSLLCLETSSEVKTLGIYWNPALDQFVFKITKPEKELPCTKRSVLSAIAKLFDPVGWLAPVIIIAKIFMQTLWRSNIGWDDNLPIALQDEWTLFQQNLEGLNSLTINRFAFFGTPIVAPSLNCPFSSSYVKFCLAGFCDASTTAYAAVVYLCAYQGSHASISLVTSKTRVAPVKTVSVPRLELCSASLLAELLPSVRKALHLPIHSIRALTDSTVSLAWIKSHPDKWKTFVANRVTTIQAQISSDMWGHVSGEENPADCASRGLDPNQLKHHSLWWNGPSWLKTTLHNPNELEPDLATANSEAKQVLCHVVVTDPPFYHRSSSFEKILRVTAYVSRFINRCRRKSTVATSQSVQPYNLDRFIICPTTQFGQPINYLTTEELDAGRVILIRLSQQEMFPAEGQALRNNTLVPKNSKLFSLCPFLDKSGILRVGGRLKNAPISEEQRHPIILSGSSHFTKLIVRSVHLSHLHGGLQLVMSVLQRQYWIIGARNAVRQQIRKCIVCAKIKATTLQPMMADIPDFRVTPARPFLRCGVDYAGPFLIRPSQPRSKVTMKAYLALFVCCTTRALHLEVVSDATTGAFLAALRRFVSRRGLPSDMYSDCGTNFVGANHDMKEFLTMLRSSSSTQEITNDLLPRGITWHFNPPASPHFGGLWEAGVKSTKYHLRRVMGIQRLTFEELTTVITQIEAILNSRPITPETSDPNDPVALTPGHFLIGAPLTSVPEPSLDHLNINRLSRWQLVQQLVQSFWKRWSTEYLSLLQQRAKWITGTKPIQVNDLVIIKEDNVPPQQWRMGRVVTLHPGLDSIVRVVTLRTAAGLLKRPVVKVCILPVDASDCTSQP